MKPKEKEKVIERLTGIKRCEFCDEKMDERFCFKIKGLYACFNCSFLLIGKTKRNINYNRGKYAFQKTGKN
jgi:ribosomal protein L37AE/L43A